MIDGHSPGTDVPTTGRYRVTTLSGDTLGSREIGLFAGQKFPPSREIAGPGVEVRYVLIEACAYLTLAS